MTRLAEMDGHATLASIGYRCEAFLIPVRERRCRKPAAVRPLGHVTRCNVTGAVYCRDPAVNVEHSDYGAFR